MGYKQRPCYLRIHCEKSRLGIVRIESACLTHSLQRVLLNPGFLKLPPTFHYYPSSQGCTRKGSEYAVISRQ